MSWESDLCALCEGEDVMVQLRGKALLATRSAKGGIQPGEMPHPEWIQATVAAFREEHKRMPSDDELDALLDDPSAPTIEAVRGILIGRLRMKGEVLVLRYPANERTKVDLVLQKGDVAHVSVLPPVLSL